MKCMAATSPKDFMIWGKKTLQVVITIVSN